MTTKKTPMIRLKRVKTFPATMLATERLVRSSTGPSWRSRFGGLLAGESTGMTLVSSPLALLAKLPPPAQNETGGA